MRKLSRPQMFLIAILLIALTAILASPLTRTMFGFLFQGNSPGLSFWAGFLQSEDPDRIFSGAAGVGEYGESGSPAIPLMLEVMHDPDRGRRVGQSSKRTARENVVRAIGKTGSGAKPYVPEVAEFLSDTEQTMRLETAIALKELGPNAIAAVPALQKAGGPYTDSAPAIRVEVYKALQVIHKKALLDTLYACLSVGNESDRAQAMAFTASSLGADAVELLPRMKSIAQCTTDARFGRELWELIRRFE